MWLLYSTAGITMWRMVSSNHLRWYLKCVLCVVLFSFHVAHLFHQIFLNLLCVCVYECVRWVLLRNNVVEWQKIHGFCTNNVEEKVWRVEIHLLCTEESNHVVHICSQTLISTHLLTHFYLLKNTHMTCTSATNKFIQCVVYSRNITS